MSSGPNVPNRVLGCHCEPGGNDTCEDARIQHVRRRHRASRLYQPTHERKCIALNRRLTPGSCRCGPRLCGYARFRALGRREPHVQGCEARVSGPHSYGPGYSSHMFIVTHARYPGDPKAQIRSWGKSSARGRDGKLGRVDGKTTGLSEGTYATDVAAWRSLAKNFAASKEINAGTDYTAISAKDGKVASVGQAAKEDKTYHMDGPNSNSAAQAVANRAQGSPVATPDAHDSAVGTDETSKVQFDEAKIESDRRQGLHNVHVPPK